MLGCGAGIRLCEEKDLDVVRTIFRGRAAYVMSDPLTFQSFRLDTKGYSIFIALTTRSVSPMVTRSPSSASRVTTDPAIGASTAC